jgi:hypothetical protein
VGAGHRAGIELMSLFRLKIAPGQNRGGTEAKSAGSWYSGTLVANTVEGDLRPERGWTPREVVQVEGGPAAITGLVRTLFVYKDDNDVSRIVAGSHTGLFVVYLNGNLIEITPAEFTEGTADTSVQTGYGGGDYSGGDYGTARPLTDEPLDCSVWTLWAWGPYLVACCSTDGTIYKWENDDEEVGVPVPNAPTLCRAIVVAENFLMALGADGNPRKIAWCDRGFNEIWVPDATNSAGDFLLPTPGRLMCGTPLGGQALILTDVDAWIGDYGGEAVWTFTKIGDGMGAISQGALINASTRAFWWGDAGFMICEAGFARILPCPVWDLVSGELNVAQKAKVSVFMNSLQNEVGWYYPSTNSNECDRKVTVNYVTWKWWTTDYDRTAACDRGALDSPLAVDPDGLLYDHEVGFAYDGEMVAKARTGPIQIGEGDFVMEVQGYVPDQRTFGEATLTLYTKNRPMDEYTNRGTWPAAEVVDFLIDGRIIEVEFTFTGDGRIGEPQLEIIRGGKA